jgi:hypothetical protein
MNKIITKALFCLLFINIVAFSFATLKVEMGNSLQTGSYYTFPDLSVSNNSVDEKGYVIRFKFTAPVEANDEITLPALPTNWYEHSGSTKFERVICISGGANTVDLQAFLRDVQIKVTDARKGQELLVWIASDSNDSNKSFYYFPGNGHWYENVIANLTWTEAYNAALDRTFSGLKGSMVTITSAEENVFANSQIVQKNNNSKE